MLDTWLTKSDTKYITIRQLVFPELNELNLEMERINDFLDNRQTLKNIIVSQDIFNSKELYYIRENMKVYYGHYMLSGDKGLENNLLTSTIQNLLLDSLNFNNGFEFDYENFEYKLTSGRFIKLIENGVTVKILFTSQIEIKSKLDGTTVNTQPLQFNINIDPMYDLWNESTSILDRMNINLINDGTYSLSPVKSIGNSIVYTEISNRTQEEEDEWFFDFWRNQQEDFVRTKFGIENPKIEPIVYNNSWYPQQQVCILMDKSKDTFEDTFKAVYGVDYQESINRLINEGRGFEAALLKSMQKIKVFGKILSTRNNIGDRLFITRDFYSTTTQIFLDENETIGFGGRDTTVQWWQYYISYTWKYNIVLW